MAARLRTAFLAALVSLVVAAPAAFAYDGEVGEQVDIEGPGRVVCPAAVSATVTVVDKEGKPIPGAVVTWSTGATGTTDAKGQHTITLQVASSVTVTATTASGAVGRLLITCVQAGIALPRTDATLPSDPAPIPWWAYLLAVVAGPGLLVLAARRR